MTASSTISDLTKAMIVLTLGAALIGCVNADARRRGGAGELARIEAEQRELERQRAANLAKAQRMYERDVPRLYDRYSETNDPEKRVERLFELIGKLEEIRELAPRLPKVRIDLAYAYMDASRFQSAQVVLVEETEIAPNDPRPWYNLGSLYLDRGWPEEAKRYFTLSLERDENYLPAMRGVIRVSDLDQEADADLLAIVRRALLLESDPKWELYLRREQLRIETQLDESSPLVGG